jgi:hypothetical protein
VNKTHSIGNSRAANGAGAGVVCHANTLRLWRQGQRKRLRRRGGFKLCFESILLVGLRMGRGQAGGVDTPRVTSRKHSEAAEARGSLPL